jgi:putative acetyltransferase
VPALAPFEERHVPAVLALIGAVFAEYDLTFDPAGYDNDLLHVPEKYFDAGGEFWVLEDEGAVVGTVAVVPLSKDEIEVKRVYLAAHLRGQGWGQRLVGHVLDWAIARGHRRATLWSDTKFDRAHVMYQRLGFVQFGIRDCDDIDQSREYGFARDLPPLPAVGR